MKATWQPRQAGTGDPSPENIRAISGMESVEVTRCGKNLVDLSDLYVSASNAEMNVSGDSVRVYTTGEGGTWRGARTPAFLLRKGITYTLSAALDTYVSGDARIGLRGADDNTFLSGASLVFGSETRQLSVTYTPDADDEVYLSLLCTNDTILSGDCTFSNIQLEIGSAATEYEPYRAMGGTTATLTLPEEVFGGEVDAATGQGQETWTVVELDGTNKSAVASTMPCAQGAYAYVTSATGALQMEDFPALCSHFAVVPKDAPASQKVAGTMIAGLTSSGVPNIWFFSDQPSVEAFNTWLAAQSDAGTAVQAAYKLATPTSITATGGQQIVAQDGVNTIFTDADGVTVTFLREDGNEQANVTGNLADSSDGYASTVSQMNEISISGEDMELTKLEIDYVPQVR